MYISALYVLKHITYSRFNTLNLQATGTLSFTETGKETPAYYRNGGRQWYLDSINC